MEYIRYYRVKDPVDTSVLPTWQRNYVSNMKFLSTYKQWSPSTEMSWGPDSRWHIDEARGRAVIVLGKLHGKETPVGCTLQRVTEGRWVLDVLPDYHPFGWKMLRMDPMELHVLQRIVETYLFEVISDVFGAEVRRQQDRKKKDTTLYAKDVVLIPFYGMPWLRYDPADGMGGGDAAGKMYFPDDPQWKPTPTSVSIRQGMSWLEVRSSPDTQDYDTILSFERYCFDVYRICACCTRNNPRPIAELPRLQLEAPITCGMCGDTLLDDDGEPLDDRYVNSVDVRTVWQRCQEPAHCLHCRIDILPMPKLVCPECETPTPTQVEDVVTVIQRVGAKVPIYSFQLFEPPAGGSILMDWANLPAVWPPKTSRSPEVAANVAAGFDPNYRPALSGHYVTISEPDQARLIGSPLYDELDEMAEERT